MPPSRLATVDRVAGCQAFCSSPLGGGMGNDSLTDEVDGQVGRGRLRAETERYSVLCVKEANVSTCSCALLGVVVQPLFKRRRRRPRTVSLKASSNRIWREMGPEAASAARVWEGPGSSRTGARWPLRPEPGRATESCSAAYAAPPPPSLNSSI